MGTNQKLSTLRQEATRQLILETGFQLFSENTIEAITMADVANAAGVGVATVYRYFNTKQTLVLAISTWIWEKNIQEAIRSGGIRNATAAETFEYYLDVFLSLYHNNRNVLRFNQFFNVYFGKEGAVSEDAAKSFSFLLEDALLPRFEELLRTAEEDHSMRTDIPAKKIMLTTLHLMLAAVTRYAVGLVYTDGSDPDQELAVLKEMLMERYTTTQRKTQS